MKVLKTFVAVLVEAAELPGAELPAAAIAEMKDRNSTHLILLDPSPVDPLHCIPVKCSSSGNISVRGTRNCTFLLVWLRMHPMPSFASLARRHAQ